MVNFGIVYMLNLLPADPATSVGVEESFFFGICVSTTNVRLRA